MSVVHTAVSVDSARYVLTAVRKRCDHTKDPHLAKITIYLTLVGPQSRFGGKLLIIRVICPHVWECGAKGVDKGALWHSVVFSMHLTLTFRLISDLSARTSYELL